MTPPYQYHDKPEMEEELIIGIRSSDEKAFAQLFKTHYVDLVGYAESYLGSHEEAEEVVCELFARIYEIKDRWRPSGSIRGYLFRSVRNRVLNLQRSNARQSMRDALFAKELPAYDRDGLPSSLEQAEEDAYLLQALDKAISALSPRAREVVSLRWKSGMDDETIAEILNTTVPGVRMQASRALKILRKKLPEYLK